MALLLHSLSIRLVVLTFILCRNLPLGKSKFVVFGRDKLVQNVSINLDRPVFTVNENFLSVAITSGIMRNHWPDVNFTSKRLYTLAKGLSPAFLRVGGAREDFLIYKDSKEFQIHKHFTNFTITHEDLDKIHRLSSKAGWDVMFGLNVLLRGRDGAWNASNPKEIMQYVADHDYHFGWELGNEPNLFGKFNYSISPEELAEGFHTLREILKSSPQFGNFLVGPDVTRVKSTHSKSASYLESFLTHAKDVIDAVTWHQYYMDGRTCSEKDFYSPDVLDYLLHELNAANSIVSKIDPGCPRWLGETSSAYGAGAPGMSDRYVAGFMCLDKLGLAARLGHEVVMRQTFVGGNYALLDKNLEPNPDYWLSLLHKRLVGVKVLDVSGGTEEKRQVRVYAHCSLESKQYRMGSVTLLVLNVNLHDPVMIKLTGELKGQDVDEYLLTPENSDLLTKTVRLNGKVLNLVDDRTLPELVPKSVPGDEPLILPPLTFGFYVIPDARASACG